MLSLAQSTPSPNEIPNIARKITNACSLYLPRFPSQEELTYPNNSLIEFDNFVKFTEWMVCEDNAYIECDILIIRELT